MSCIPLSTVVGVSTRTRSGEAWAALVAEYLLTYLVSTRTLGARAHGHEGWKRQYRLLLQARARVVERRRIALGRMDVHVRAR